MPNFQTAMTTQSYFRAISQNLKGWEINETSLYILAFTALAILISLFVSLISKRLSSSRMIPDDVFTITSPKEIGLLFLAALNNRSKFEISFDPESRQSTNCTLTELKSRKIILELPQAITPTKGWIGRSIYTYFGLPQGKNKMNFYFFQTKIQDIFTKNGYFFLQAPLPNQIEIKQKRRHLRIAPPPSQIEQIQVWIPKYDKTENLITDPQLFGPPLFVFDQKKGIQDIVPMDISALGIRLKISKSSRRKTLFDPEKQQDLIVYLQLKNNAQGKPLALYFLSRIRNKFEEFTTKELEIGIQFMARGQPNREKPGNLVWEKIIPKEGVDELANWVFRQHLKWYREKGLDLS